MSQLSQKEIEDFYRQVNNVWPDNDKWHDISQLEIQKYIHRFCFTNCTILNAGSGGNNYGLTNEMIHVDIAENKIKNTKKYYVCSIENMPFQNESFDVIICVGSVLNYCDAVKAINEMSRVLKPGGILILEFENSYSFEFMKTAAYKTNASIITTNYFNKPHKMWVYSPNYISKILSKEKMIVKDVRTFHILSSLSYYYNRNENKAAKYASLDKIFRHIPIIRKHSGNIILFAKKQ